MINSIVVVGATHGNELSGVQLVKNWQAKSVNQQYSTFSSQFVLANTPAIDANRRFVEEDLNRQFSIENLLTPGPSQEAQLAASINKAIGPKGSNSQTDLVIDIHNTTSHMGATLIVLELDEFSTELCRYVKAVMPEANILVEDEKPFLEHRYLCTVGKRGVMVEVGAQPQGVLRQDIFELTEKMTLAIMTFCELWNSEAVLPSPACEAFRLGEEIRFPLDGWGEREAMIHSNIQDKDFYPVLPGEPIFKRFSGEDIVWEGSSTIYPHFINEAAYHKADIAFATAVQFIL